MMKHILIYFITILKKTKKILKTKTCRYIWLRARERKSLAT